jgi:hypothetical protein
VFLSGVAVVVKARQVLFVSFRASACFKRCAAQQTVQADGPAFGRSAA